MLGKMGANTFLLGIRVRALQKQCPDVLKNSVRSFFGGEVEGETMGERDILLKIEKVIGFSWLTRSPALC